MPPPWMIERVVCDFTTKGATDEISAPAAIELYAAAIKATGLRYYQLDNIGRSGLCTVFVKPERLVEFARATRQYLNDTDDTIERLQARSNSLRQAALHIYELIRSEDAIITPPTKEQTR